MGQRDVKARFYGGCTVVLDNRHVMSHVGFETAGSNIARNGGNGTILQEFIDEDG